ncbi:MAG: type II toxin-antitoxin system RelE/ParE family toxin, partial [Planctomycetes bacterium]|nr:type II toxin-antitoxin system RelE/ParE family toxin [Planctomycetota bacterium]
MSLNIGIRPQARMDVVELAAYIGRDGVAAADRFLDACEATFELIAEAPHIGSIIINASVFLFAYTTMVAW